MIQIDSLRSFSLDFLQNGLSPRLTYHALRHTQDVVCQSLRLAGELGLSPTDTALVETAAWWHDAGYTATYPKHEEMSARLATEYLPRFGVSRQQLQIINGIILATRIPQSPSTILEKIVCDADLDYLGRDDFEPQAADLMQEWLNYNIIKSEAEFDPIQVKFLTAHHYHTELSITLRNPIKEKHLAAIKERLESRKASAATHH